MIVGILITRSSADLLGQNRLGNNRLSHLYGRGRKIMSRTEFEKLVMASIRQEFLNRE